jgi:hypothetical protein
VPPRPPGRPGQLITSAVLAFVQAGLVLFASLYVWFFASVVDIVSNQPGFPSTADGLATEGTVIAIVQLVSVAVLIWAGIWALTRRTQASWRLLLAAHAVQIVLTVYWIVRLSMLSSDVPGPDPGSAFIAFSLIVAAGPLVGIGLVAGGAGKRSYDGRTSEAGARRARLRGPGQERGMCGARRRRQRCWPCRRRAWCS